MAQQGCLFQVCQNKITYFHIFSVCGVYIGNVFSVSQWVSLEKLADCKANPPVSAQD